jgi:hypothetical protein
MNPHQQTTLNELTKHYVVLEKRTLFGFVLNEEIHYYNHCNKKKCPLFWMVMDGPSNQKYLIGEKKVDYHSYTHKKSSNCSYL